ALEGLCGSAWSLRKARDFVVSFTKAFVIESVVKVSKERGVVEACVFCECVNKMKRPCITVDSSSSPVCRTGIPPSLAYTSGTYNVTQNNEFLVGGVEERGEGSRETIYVLDSNQTNF
ncbi:hypothetical protein, partial [Salmonella sp. s54836]|uniref:hypothetical protein n=1 Tax=Salmonella sp. s54836 TaxID=3159673 RepID=UPI00398007D6